MAESHRRTAGSSSRLTPEEITNRGFASAFRGISETEVRNFLKRVADEIGAMRAREADLARQVEELQEQLANPTPVTEEQLLGSLGEETARVLRSAQEAAEEIRKRAEERASGMVRDAQEQSTKLREDAQQQAETRTTEADAHAAEVEQQAEARATELREEAERVAEELRTTATQETDAQREQTTAAADAEIERAKASGRALVEEARTVRERVLADLGRRRSLLQAQVDELRSGRDRLLDAYRVVKRTLSDATDALAQVEARANAELAAPAPRVTVPPVEGELEILEPGDAAPAEGDTEIDLAAETVVVLDEDQGATRRAGGGSPDSEDSGAAVDALFARLRASHTADEPDPPAAPDGPPAGPDAPPEASAHSPAEAEAPAEPEPAAAVEEPGPEASVPKASEPESEAPDATAAAPEAAGEGGVESRSPDEMLRAEREEVLAPLSRDLIRRAKRALQDQQNELLDQIRTIKGKVSSEDVLPTSDAQEAAWVAVLDEPLRAAYRSGNANAAESLGGAGSDSALPSDLLGELAQVMVGPWRERLVAAIDGAADDPDAITQRLGARYREYRGRELEGALGDALAASWAMGAFAAVPDGTLLRWVPAEVGHCPDCDDNALEPTARNEPFPTGQLFPPAHPGCRCFLAVVQPVPASQ